MRVRMSDDFYQLLLHWMCEREKARVGSTDDPIIREWRFCNVNRCDDRETRWIFRHVIAAHEDSSSLWFNLVVARFINWSPTLETIGYFEEWDAPTFIARIEAIPAGTKVYTGAYMVPAGPAGIQKHRYLADCVFTRLWDLAYGRAVGFPMPPRGATLADWSNFLRQAPLMGDFLRNQIVTDLRYTRYLEGATDWETFVLPGPGTQRGLNRLHELPLSTHWGAGEASRCLQSLRSRILADDPRWAPMLRDINNLSNCMCEFDKYCRVFFGEGKPRARYVPSKEPLP